MVVIARCYLAVNTQNTARNAQVGRRLVREEVAGPDGQKRRGLFSIVIAPTRQMC